MAGAIAWYDANADVAAARYEQVAPERLHAWLADLLPAAPAAALDVGAGSGRDSAWLASKGYDVVAVEPSPRMRVLARERHAVPPIRWLADALPALPRTFKTGLSFDLILLSAVWMHVAPTDRPRAFRKLINLLKPGGLLALTLRHGPSEPGRAMHPVSETEIRTLARDHGALVERCVTAGDQQGRDDVRWTQMALRLPDDGTDALPLLRHVILNDEKSSSYKLALLRVLCRVADASAGLCWQIDDDHVGIPMGLVALTWLRLYKPLLANDLPQSPTNHQGGDNLGFAKRAFRQLAAVSPHDLRVGTRISTDSGIALHQALKDAASTITRMPVHYMTYPNGGPILAVDKAARTVRPIGLVLNAAYLASFGTMRMPGYLWLALQRFSAWIEPAVLAEWIRLTKLYAERQGRVVDDASLSAAMTWTEPKRDVGEARRQATRLIDASGLTCVWSGRRLREDRFDIDHCLPWSIWPCADLWNLMPVHRTLNQREKRDRLPADGILRAAQERIMAWWHSAYQVPSNPAVAERFVVEASASLPGVASPQPRLDDVYSALSLQRMRLKHDQQVPEWSGERYLDTW